MLPAAADQAWEKEQMADRRDRVWRWGGLVVVVGLLALWGCNGGPPVADHETVISVEEIQRFANAEQQLTSVDPQLRQQAAVALLSMKHPGALATVLHRLRNDRNSPVRISMIEAAAFCIDHRCFGAVLDAIKDPDEAVKDAAASALGRFSKPEEVRAMQALASDLSTTPREEELIFRALGEGFFIQAVPALLRGLESNSEGTRIAAWKALMRISGRSFPPESDSWATWWEANQHRVREDVLEERVRQLTLELNVVNDRSEDLKEQFEELSALVRAPAAKVPGLLLEALVSKHQGIREYAAFGLASMSPQELKGISLDTRETYDLLRRALKDPSTQMRESIVGFIVSLKGRFRDQLLLEAMQDKSPSVLVKAIDAVNRGMGRAAISPLCSALANPEAQVREAAANALGKIDSEEAVDALLEALQDEEQNVRWFAVDGLRKLNATRAVVRLCGLLERDPSARVREITASALGDLGQPAAVLSLRKALTDESERVRTKAVGALQALAAGDDAERMMVIARTLSEHGFTEAAAVVLREAIEDFEDRPELESQLIAARKELAEVFKLEKNFRAAAAVYVELDTLTGGERSIREELIHCWLAAGEGGRIVPTIEGWIRAARQEDLADVFDLGCDSTRKLIAERKGDLAAQLAASLLEQARLTKSQTLIQKVEQLTSALP